MSLIFTPIRYSTSLEATYSNLFFLFTIISGQRQQDYEDDDQDNDCESSSLHVTRSRSFLTTRSSSTCSNHNNNIGSNDSVLSTYTNFDPMDNTPPAATKKRGRKRKSTVPLLRFPINPEDKAAADDTLSAQPFSTFYPHNNTTSSHIDFDNDDSSYKRRIRPRSTAPTSGDFDDQEAPIRGNSNQNSVFVSLQCLFHDFRQEMTTETQ